MQLNTDALLKVHLDLIKRSAQLHISKITKFNDRECEQVGLKLHKDISSKEFREELQNINNANKIKEALYLTSLYNTEVYHALSSSLKARIDDVHEAVINNLHTSLKTASQYASNNSIIGDNEQNALIRESVSIAFLESNLRKTCIEHNGRQ